MNYTADINFTKEQCKTDFNVSTTTTIKTTRRI